MSGQIARAVEEQRQAPTLVQFVQQMQPEIARALPKGMDADRMARLALTAIRRTPALARCSQTSFAGALLTAAALGLEPDVNGEAYLVPFGDECTLIVGYQGYAKLFWQHPLAKHLDAQAVHEHDDFSYAYGLEPRLTHIPARGERGQVIYYYAVASLTTGASVFEVMTPAEVQAVRKAAASHRKGPQIADPQHWMERKTVLRQLVKRLPRSTAHNSAIVVDERAGTDLAAHKVPEQNTDGAEPDDVDPVTGEVVEPEPEPDGAMFPEADKT
jgi:recombination protein RecT